MVVRGTFLSQLPVACVVEPAGWTHVVRSGRPVECSLLPLDCGFGFHRAVIRAVASSFRSASRSSLTGAATVTSLGRGAVHVFRTSTEGVRNSEYGVAGSRDSVIL